MIKRESAVSPSQPGRRVKYCLLKDNQVTMTSHAKNANLSTMQKKIHCVKKKYFTDFFFCKDENDFIQDLKPQLNLFFVSFFIEFSRNVQFRYGSI